MGSQALVFIGTGPGMERMADVLERSILAHTDPSRVEVRHMEAWASPLWSNWHSQPDPRQGQGGRGYWVTPFSLFRYAIPEVCGFEGFVVYLDADMIVTGDILELYEYRERGWWVTAVNGDCVSVIDCAAMKGDPSWPTIGRLKRLHKDQARKIASGYFSPSIPAEWNSQDRYVEGETKLLHFTGIATQPWRPWPDLINYEPHPDEAALALWREWWS